MKNCFWKYLGICFLMFFVSRFEAQVGINTTAPNSNTLLHISELYNGSVNAKGLIIPRLTESQRDAKWNLSSNSLSATDEGLTIYNTDEKCFNYYNSDENSWKSLCGSIGNAKFTMDCSSMSVNGSYVEGNNLNDSNFVLYAVVNVSKPGFYSIYTNNVNGYSFAAHGVFTSVGNVKIKLAGQGKPEAATSDTFQVTSSGTAANPVCSFSVAVQSAVSTYSMNCSNIVVNGKYVKGEALNSSNTIRVTLNVSNQGSYMITTPVKNGISFSASGVFSNTGSQQITLAGSGTPTVNSDFSIPVNANSTAGNSSCEANIPMTLPALTYGVIGDNSTYSWTGIRKTALVNGSSFGPNGVVKIKGLNQAWATNSADTAAGNITSNTPDIIMYFAYSAPNSAQLTNALTDYVKKGGVLIYASTSDTAGLTDTRTLLNGIFNLPSTAVNWQTNCSANCPSSYPNDDNDYLINATLSDDPIVNGPFGNLAGKYWGEDNGTNGTMVLSQLPSGSIQVCSANNNWGHTNVNPSSSVVWYNNNYNFFMFGDTVGADVNNTDVGGYPSIFNSNGVPLSKQYGNGDNSASPFVYVSALELNVVAWALKKAATSGINSH